MKNRMQGQDRLMPFEKEPSIFALLIDDISKMTPSEQKLLWIELNKEKLHGIASELDNSIKQNNLSDEDIATLVREARNRGKK